MILTFRVVGFGWNGGGILLDPAVQSSKLIAVWTELEPLPKVYADPVPIVVGLVGFGFIHAVVYRSVAPAWPAGVVPRATRFAGVLFGIGFAFWEFFTPFNLFEEPVFLVGLELVLWEVIAGTEAMSIAVVCESERVEEPRMTYFDEEDGAALETAFEDVVSDWPDVTATTMFGCPSYRADGTLFAVLVTDGVALTRLPGDYREQVEQAFETGPFQAGERTVTKWVQVTVEDVSDLDALVPYVKASYESALEESD